MKLSQLACRFLWPVGFATLLFVTDIGHWTGGKAKIARSLLPVVAVVEGVGLLAILISPFIGCLEGLGHKKY